MRKNQFTWKSMGKVFPKAPVGNATDNPNRITIRKMFDAGRKEPTVKIL